MDVSFGNRLNFGVRHFFSLLELFQLYPPLAKSNETEEADPGQFCRYRLVLFLHSGATPSIIVHEPTGPCHTRSFDGRGDIGSMR